VSQVLSTADNIQGVGLDSATPNWSASTDANIDDALESERETVGCLLVKPRFWIKAWGWFGRTGRDRP